jgi:hypothetical protein
MRKTTSAAVAAAAFLACPALANDSSAELRQGGLVLMKNPGVEMRSEDLFISPRAVRVRYRFANTSGRDQSVLVAFPMPDITTTGPDDNLAIPGRDPANFLAFTTRVEGRPVAAQVEQKAIKRGVDRTAYLRRLGIPLAPHLAQTGNALDRLPKAAQAELIRFGMAVPDEFDSGRGWERHLAPAWTLKTTYYWTQLFPAGREVGIEHAYVPSVGETSGTMLESDWSKASADYRRMLAKYCIDKDFLSAVARAKQGRGKDRQAFFEKRIDYVLSSGGNWKAPIADFRLTVDKGGQASLISFCMDGVKKTGPTSFEVRKANFRPRRDLAILILQPAPAGF